MICASLGGAELWASQGGLIGLVTMALFVTVFTFIRVITKIVADDRVERKDVRRSNDKTFNKLGDALDGLTDELRKGRKPDK